MTEPRATTELTGHFEDRPVVWHDVGVEHCQVCGRLLLRQVWLFDDAKRGQILACGPGCEELWFGYLEPRLPAPVAPASPTNSR